MASYAARTKAMFQKYGRVAVGVHFAVYAAGLGSEFCFSFLSMTAMLAVFFVCFPLALHRAHDWVGGGGGKALGRHSPITQLGRGAGPCARAGERISSGDPS